MRTFEATRDAWVARCGFRVGTFDDCTNWKAVERRKAEVVAKIKAASKASAEGSPCE